MSKYNLKNKYIFLPFLLLLIPLKGFAKITDEQKMLLEGLPPDQRASIIEKMDMMAQAQGELDEIFEDPNTLIRRPELDADEEED